MSLLEYKNKFDIKNPKVGKTFTEEQFFRWTNSNFYRTSYNDMRERSPVEKKNCVVPGYKGFMPGVASNNIFGKTMTETSRRSFDKLNLDDKVALYSSTGFNSGKIPKADGTLHATSNRYGKTTILDTHPNIKNSQFDTSTRASYLSPQKLSKPNWRTRQTSANHDLVDVNIRGSCRASGFV